MSLSFFKNTPLTVGTQVGLNDYATGNGSLQDFVQVNKVYTSLGNITQAGNTFYRKSNGGVTPGVNPEDVHLSTAPAVDVDIVFPSTIAAQLSAYDRIVPSVPNSQRDQKTFHIADIADIVTRIYENAPADAGIKVYMTERIVGGGADPSWFKFAPLLADFTVGTYGVAGDPLYLANDIIGVNELDGGVLALDTTIDLLDATDFFEAQWIIIDIENDPDYDIVWVEDITANTLTLHQALTHNHSSGASVYAVGTGFSVEMNVPTDAGGGIALSLFNVSLDADYKESVR